MRVELSPFVEGDLSAIGDYIAKDNPLRAVSFVREIRNRFALIGRDPLAYPLRPDIGVTARVMVFGNYLVLYRVVNDLVRIERVVHGRRDLRDFI